MNLPLFDPPPADPAESPHKPCIKDTGFDRPDVLRIVQHKAGPFRQLLNGQPSGREFRYVELQEHSLWIEFTDNGERIPAPALTAMLIDDGLASGMFVEVRA